MHTACKQEPSLVKPTLLATLHLSSPCQMTASSADSGILLGSRIHIIRRHRIEPSEAVEIRST